MGGFWMEHIVSLKNREELHLSGVEHIYAFNDTKIELRTVNGDVKIEGEKMDMGKLSIEDGVIHVKGHIHSIIYTKSSKKEEEGFFKRLFK